MNKILSNPKISVVIFSYNFEKYIGECIESVLSQTLQPFEIIICDDHSTDNTHSILTEYARKYPELIKVHIHEKNIGIALNGDFGIRQPHGDLLSWMDGDDRWLPRKLELEWKALCENPEARVAYSNIFRIDSLGNRIGIFHDSGGYLPPSGDVFFPVFSRNFFQNTSSIFRNHLIYRSCYDEIGYLDTSLESLWDWDEKIRLAARYPVVYSGQALVEYRSHPGGFSKQNHEKHLSAFIKIYEKYVNFLERYAQEDRVRVKCRLESMIAIKLPASSYNEKYSCLNVFCRIQSRFKYLTNEACQSITQENKNLLEAVERKAVEEFISVSSKRIVLKNLLKNMMLENKKFNLKHIVKSFIPDWLHASINFFVKK
ncbi:MAG: glycosyltransferase [Nitrospirae bacterium]|nr:glycosyltransferase [Nitrospirota bacterium]